MIKLRGRRPDYYTLLDVDSDASTEEIGQAFRRRVKHYHPDLNTSSGARETFLRLTEAYHVLRDGQRRRSYDAFLDHQLAMQRARHNARHEQGLTPGWFAGLGLTGAVVAALLVLANVETSVPLADRVAVAEHRAQLASAEAPARVAAPLQVAAATAPAQASWEADVAPAKLPPLSDLEILADLPAPAPAEPAAEPKVVAALPPLATDEPSPPAVAEASTPVEGRAVAIDPPAKPVVVAPARTRAVATHARKTRHAAAQTKARTVARKQRRAARRAAKRRYAAY